MTTNSIEYNKKNYKKFWWKPEHIKARSLRNKARSIMAKKWLVKKWDWKEVDHKAGTNAGNWPENLRVISRLRNRILWQKKATISHNSK